MTNQVTCEKSTVLLPQSCFTGRCEGDCEGIADDQDNFPLMNCPTHFGEYQLIEEIGRGAMGIVYKARQIRLKRIVALKMLHPARLRREGAIEQFFAEAELAAQLDHPGIVPVHDVGHDNGQPFICIAFVDGENLEARLKRRPLEIEEVVRLLADVADAIEHAHDRGIIHRDLKPANILLDRAGRPRITDFGLARRLDDNAATSPVIAGTPPYMSPEQASAQNGRVGVASDVYTLGVVLYHCLTGQPPFTGKDSYSILRQVMQTEPPLPRSIDPSIPEELERIALRCLRKEPAGRYASAAELACELRQFGSCQQSRRVECSGSRVNRTPGSFRLVKRRFAARPIWAALCATILLFLLSSVVPGHSDKVDDHESALFAQPKVTEQLPTSISRPPDLGIVRSGHNDGHRRDAHGV
jgi:serine/threonine protein kinase